MRYIFFKYLKGDKNYQNYYLHYIQIFSEKPCIILLTLNTAACPAVSFEEAGSWNLSWPRTPAGNATVPSNERCEINTENREFKEIDYLDKPNKTISENHFKTFPFIIIFAKNFKYKFHCTFCIVLHTLYL